MKMKKVQNLLFLPLLMIVMSLNSCTREGFGGDARIAGGVAHHGLRIPNAVVYIKFNAKELPGTLVSDFDASVEADAQGAYTFENLKKGDYYLYSVGYDSSISEVVRGGLTVNIAEKDQSLAKDIAVTE
jgi:hypothetical protein